MKRLPSGRTKNTRETHSQNHSRRPYLYVGNLSPQVSEQHLFELFEQLGVVRTTKVITPAARHGQAPQAYGFVEFARLQSAENALSTLQYYSLFGRPLHVNWARQGTSAGEPLPSWVAQAVANTQSRAKSSPPLISYSPSSSSTFVCNTSPNLSAIAQLYTVFVGDLAPEVKDATLVQAFCIFPSLFDARVIWDTYSNCSKGYGFVRFEEESDAFASITTMQGQWLGSRPIRLNWATRRLESCANRDVEELISGKLPDPSTTFDQNPGLSALYVGGLPPDVTTESLSCTFQVFGTLLDVEMFQARRFAFVKFAAREEAVKAMQYYQFHPLYIQGRRAKVGWARYMPRQRNEQV
ncbi:E3 ubiquitin-protein ligase pub1 [Malassezia yamatoensis]|uniref:E3 ubiquitin-protein ligase pub1 n=1 Tax=Malassezia yamatoensis TaxID=253288 RepID=A0AAJ6CG74_9BASI|nr:E3 ubiquitin-protein ligase pub1 [Malassezia yamatoensis]